MSVINNDYFKLSKSQEKKFKKWKKENKFKSEDAGAAGGAFSFEFTPTSIGTLITVKYMDDESTKLDLTEDLG